ncbi:ACT domain-containing protein [Candidatus Woesearchaeota archaeon]|nr:ACT domain-containing protein [Candidatus Woesearchaeota archaeon]
MNLTRLTEQHIEAHPSIRDCLRKRMLNYSQLARSIVKDNNLRARDFDAVLVAARRYSWKLSKSGKVIAEDGIRSLLAKSRIDIRTKMAVAVIDKHIYSDDLLDLERKVKGSRNVFYAIEGTDAITVITAASHLAEIQGIFKSSVIRLWKDMALVVISSPEQIEETPGVFSYLSALLSDRGINVLEAMSCWSETLFVVAEADIARVLGALRF